MNELEGADLRSLEEVYQGIIKVTDSDVDSKLAHIKVEEEEFKTKNPEAPPWKLSDFASRYRIESDRSGDMRNRISAHDLMRDKYITQYEGRYDTDKGRAIIEMLHESESLFRQLVTIDGDPVEPSTIKEKFDQTEHFKWDTLGNSTDFFSVVNHLLLSPQAIDKSGN